MSAEPENTSGTLSERTTTDSASVGRFGWESCTTATTKVSSSSILSSTAKHNSSIQELQRFRLSPTEAAISVEPFCRNSPLMDNRLRIRWDVPFWVTRFTTREPQSLPQTDRELGTRLRTTRFHKS